MLPAVPEVVNEVIKNPEILKEVYGDLAKPGVQQVGKALGTVFGLINTALLPIEWANRSASIIFEKNFEGYRKKVEAIPIEKIVNVAPEFGVPIVQKLTYVSEESISDLYTTLLAKASNINTIGEAHPSFVNLVQNLSPDEALLLKSFGVATAVAGLPFISMHIVLPDGGYTVSQDILINQKLSSLVKFPQNISAYISNFAGMGIVNVRRDVRLKNDDVYNEIENQHAHLKIEAVDLGGGTSISTKVVKGKIDITSFGALFLKACNPQK